MAARDFLLPDLGEGLEEAELVSWHVAEGDTVALNQPLAEVETAKAVVEIPSPFAGTIAKLHAGPGQVVKVGTPLVTFEVEGAEERPAPQARQAVLVGYGPPPEEEPSAPAAAATVPAPAATGGGDGSGPAVRATPPVRKLAKDLGVDLAAIARGSGPNGRITREDVEAAASREGAVAYADGGPVAFPEAVAPRAGDEVVPVKGVRRAVAEAMARSWREIPQVTTFLTVDFTHVMAFRQEVQRDRPDVKVTGLAIVCRALAEVAREHRKLNASWAGDHLVLRGDFHLGVATDTEHGLMVPVIRGADRLGIADLSVAIGAAAHGARSRTATPEELTGSTVTVSNVGSFGAEFGTPIVNPPEAAILAIGVIEAKPLVVDGIIEPRPASVLALTFDHRVMDGAEAGRALGALADILRSPFRLGALPR